MKKRYAEARKLIMQAAEMNGKILPDHLLDRMEAEERNHHAEKDVSLNCY